MAAPGAQELLVPFSLRGLHSGTPPPKEVSLPAQVTTYCTLSYYNTVLLLLASTTAHYTCHPWRSVCVRE